MVDGFVVSVLSCFAGNGFSFQIGCFELLEKRCRRQLKFLKASLVYRIVSGFLVLLAMGFPPQNIYQLV